MIIIRQVPGKEFGQYYFFKDDNTYRYIGAIHDTDIEYLIKEGVLILIEKNEIEIIKKVKSYEYDQFSESDCKYLKFNTNK